MHPGLLTWDGQQVVRIVTGKTHYDAPTDSYTDDEARWAWFKALDGTLWRWARKVPNPAPGIAVYQFPTDADPTFRYTIVGVGSAYDHTFTLNIVRRSTGTGPADAGAGYWTSDGGGEWYDVTATAQNTHDPAIPAEFDAEQIPSDVITSTPDSFQDPRAAV